MWLSSQVTSRCTRRPPRDQAATHERRRARARDPSTGFAQTVNTRRQGVIGPMTRHKQWHRVLGEKCVYAWPKAPVCSMVHGVSRRPHRLAPHDARDLLSPCTAAARAAASTPPSVRLRVVPGRTGPFTPDALLSGLSLMLYDVGARRPRRMSREIVIGCHRRMLLLRSPRGLGSAELQAERGERGELLPSRGE